MIPAIAALPMYDWPEARAVTDAEWAGLRARLVATGIDAPERIVRRNADMPAVPGGIRDDHGQVIAPDPATLPPDGLDFHTLWKHPGLLIAQTCWGPMEQGLAEAVVVIGQPSYDGIEGGQGELYSSAILMRRGVLGVGPEGPRSFAPPSGLPAISPTRGEISGSNAAHTLAMSEIGEAIDDSMISPLVGEMAGRPEGGEVGRQLPEVLSPSDGRAILPLDLMRDQRFAYNSNDSMSGIIALTRDLQATGQGMDIFSQRLVTAAHRASIVAVAEDRADVCAIDCRSWHLAKLYEPAAAELTIVGWTARRKGLPFITSRQMPSETVERLRNALRLPIT